jgi:hypothetical protein
VRGKGNPTSFHTCSHGAGRAMSRNEAQARFTSCGPREGHGRIECRKDADVIDETPMAYKDIDAVMAAQADLVEIVHNAAPGGVCKGEREAPVAKAAGAFFVCPDRRSAVRESVTSAPRIILVCAVSVRALCDLNGIRGVTSRLRRLAVAYAGVC